MNKTQTLRGLAAEWRELAQSLRNAEDKYKDGWVLREKAEVVSARANELDALADEMEAELAHYARIAPSGRATNLFLQLRHEIIGEKGTDEPLCVDCGYPRNNSRFHLEAPGTNWGAALHHFKE